MSRQKDNTAQQFDTPLECDNTGNNCLSAFLVCCMETARRTKSTPASCLVSKAAKEAVKSAQVGPL